MHFYSVINIFLLADKSKFGISLFVNVKKVTSIYISNCEFLGLCVCSGMPRNAHRNAQQLQGKVLNHSLQRADVNWAAGATCSKSLAQSSPAQDCLYWHIISLLYCSSSKHCVCCRVMPSTLRVFLSAVLLFLITES